MTYEIHCVWCKKEIEGQKQFEMGLKEHGEKHGCPARIRFVLIIMNK